MTRTVLLVGRWAIKVPTGRGVYPGGMRGRIAGLCRGLLANQSEAIWSAFPDWDGKVAPVKASLLWGLIQVYPRCRVLDADDDTVPLPDMDPSPGDVKPENFGWWQGRVVCLDYDMS